jgi:hypothetical protein
MDHRVKPGGDGGMSARFRRGFARRDIARHCEERSDEAIQLPAALWIASLRSQ